MLSDLSSEESRETQDLVATATDALTDPKDVLQSTEATDVPQSEKATAHSGGATSTNAHPETDGT